MDDRSDIWDVGALGSLLQGLGLSPSDTQRLLAVLPRLDSRLSIFLFFLFLYLGRRSQLFFDALSAAWDVLTFPIAFFQAHMLPPMGASPPKGWPWGLISFLLIFAGSSLSPSFYNAMVAAGTLLPLPRFLRAVFLASPDSAGPFDGTAEVRSSDAIAALWATEAAGLVVKHGPGTGYPTCGVLRFRQIVQYPSRGCPFTDADGYRWFPVRYWNAEEHRWQNGFSPAQRLPDHRILLAPLGCVGLPPKRRDLRLLRPVPVYGRQGRQVQADYWGPVASYTQACLPYAVPGAGDSATGKDGAPWQPVFVFHPAQPGWIGGLAFLERPEELFYDVALQGPPQRYAVDPAQPRPDVVAPGSGRNEKVGSWPTPGLHIPLE